MRLLLLALLLAVQSPPAPQHGDKSHKIADTQTTPKPEPSQSVTTVQAPSSQPPQDNTKNQQATNKSSPHNWVDWINAFSTAVIAAFTIITACVVGRQLRATHRQERAWVIVEEEEMPKELEHWIINGPIEIEMTLIFKNYGTTPARLLESRLIFTTVDKMENLPTIPDYGDRQPYPNFPKDGAILVPNATIPAHREFCGPDKKPVAFTQEILQDIRDGKLCLFFYGFMKYEDAFGGKHETRFCQKYFVLKGMNYFSGDFRIAGSEAYNKHT